MAAATLPEQQPIPTVDLNPAPPGRSSATASPENEDDAPMQVDDSGSPLRDFVMDARLQES